MRAARQGDVLARAPAGAELSRENGEERTSPVGLPNLLVDDRLTDSLACKRSQRRKRCSQLPSAPPTRP